MYPIFGGNKGLTLTPIRHFTPPTVQAGVIFSQPFFRAIMPYVWVNDYDVQKWWVVIQCGCANLLVVWAILLETKNATLLPL